MIQADTQATVARYEHDPYGNTVVKEGAYADANPYRFSTKWFDVETGLYYNDNRYLLPRLGRWASRDPIEESGGLNLYGYVGNAPTNTVDPLGMWNADMHYGETFNIAGPEIGGECAERVARFDSNTDEGDTRPVFGDNRYHWDALPAQGILFVYHSPGARDQVRTIERERIENGIRHGNCRDVLMGVGRLLHIAQDSFSHQAGGSAGPHDAETPAQHIGCIAGTLIPNILSPNFVDPHRPDNAQRFADDFRAANNASRAIIREYLNVLVGCPCNCVNF